MNDSHTVYRIKSKTNQKRITVSRLQTMWKVHPRIAKTNTKHVRQLSTFS